MTNFKMLVAATLAAGVTMGASVANAAATTVGGNMDVTATLTSACEVSASGAIDFGSVTALLSTGNKVASSASGFQVACSSDLSPTIYSTTSRVMARAGGGSLPFQLCLAAACDGTNDMSTAQSGATALSITQDGSMKAVPLHAKILATDFQALPSGAYTQTVVINVDY